MSFSLPKKFKIIVKENDPFPEIIPLPSSPDSDSPPPSSSRGETWPGFTKSKISSSSAVDREFSVEMKQSYVSGDTRLILPFKHADTYLKNKINEFIILRVEHQEWKVKVKYSRKEYRLGQGWRDFVVSNGVKIQELVVFNLLDQDESGEIVYEVLHIPI